MPTKRITYFLSAILGTAALAASDEQAAHCASDWAQAASEPVDVLALRVARGEFVLSVACRESVSKDRQGARVAAFVARCAPAKEGDGEACARDVDGFLAEIGGLQGRPVPETLPRQLGTEAMSAGVRQVLAQPEAASAADLESAVAFAEEIGEREPESYDAAKAKLAALVLRETKHGVAVDDGELDDLVEQLGDLRREAGDGEALAERRAIAETELDGIWAELQGLEADRESVRDDVEMLTETIAAGETEEMVAWARGALAQVLAEDRELAAAEAAMSRSFAALEAEVRTALAAEREIPDVDVVRLAAWRQMARGDYAAVADEAAALIEADPTAPLGYELAAQAALRAEDPEAAAAILAEAVDAGAITVETQDRIVREASRDPAELVAAVAAALGGGAGAVAH